MFRFIYCRECGKRHRKPVETCSCGKKDFRYSDWYIRYYALGRKVEEKVGSLTLARRVLMQRELEVAEGKYNFPREKKITMREFVLDDYWNLYAVPHLKESTQKDYYNRIHQEIIPTFGNMYLHQIDRRVVDRWIAKLKMRLKKPGSVNRFIALLKGIFTQAAILKITNNNPVRDAKQFKEDNKRLRYLTTDEYHLLIEVAGNDLLSPSSS